MPTQAAPRRPGGPLPARRRPWAALPSRRPKVTFRHGSARHDVLELVAVAAPAVIASGASMASGSTGRSARWVPSRRSEPSTSVRVLATLCGPSTGTYARRSCVTTGAWRPTSAGPADHGRSGGARLLGTRGRRPWSSTREGVVGAEIGPRPPHSDACGAARTLSTISLAGPALPGDLSGQLLPVSSLSASWRRNSWHFAARRESSSITCLKNSTMSL